MKRSLVKASELILFFGTLFGLAIPSRAGQGPGAGQGVSFRLEKTSIGLGEPVLLTVGINNPSSLPIDVDLGGDGIENISISVVTPDGTTTKRPPPDHRNRIVFSGEVRLAPGRAYRETLILNEWFTFNQIGTYTVQLSAKGSFHSPSTLHLLVRPKDAAEMASLCTELVSRILSNASAQDSLASVQALTFIDDPTVVQAWTKLLDRRDFIDSAIAGLVRIGNADAAAALISRRNWPDENTRASIRSALRTIADNTSDEELRQNIQGGLSVPR